MPPRGTKRERSKGTTDTPAKRSRTGSNIRMTGQSTSSMGMPFFSGAGPSMDMIPFMEAYTRLQMQAYMGATPMGAICPMGMMSPMGVLTGATPITEARPSMHAISMEALRGVTPFMEARPSMGAISSRGAFRRPTPSMRVTSSIDTMSSTSATTSTGATSSMGLLSNKELAPLMSRIFSVERATEADEQRGISYSRGEPSFSEALGNIARMHKQMNPDNNQTSSAGLRDSTTNQPVNPAEQSVSNIPSQAFASNEVDQQTGVLNSSAEPFSEALRNLARMHRQMNPDNNQISSAGLRDNTANQLVNPTEHMRTCIRTQDAISTYFRNFAAARALAEAEAQGGEPSVPEILRMLSRIQEQNNPDSQILPVGSGDSAANQQVVPAEQSVSDFPTQDDILIYFENLSAIYTILQPNFQGDISNLGTVPAIPGALSNISRIQGQINPQINQILPADLGDNVANQQVVPADQNLSNIPTQNEMFFYYQNLAAILTLMQSKRTKRYFKFRR